MKVRVVLPTLLLLLYWTLPAQPPGPPPPPFGQRLARITVDSSGEASWKSIPKMIGLTPGMVLTEKAYEGAKAKLKKIDPSLHLVISLAGGKPAIEITAHPPFSAPER